MLRIMKVKIQTLFDSMRLTGFFDLWERGELQQDSSDASVILLGYDDPKSIHSISLIHRRGEKAVAGKTKSAHAQPDLA